MKTKIVLWGENDTDGKLLLAIELLEKDNKINIHTFGQEVATEDFYQLILDKWREGQQVPFPEHKTIERPLSISEGLLPDDIRVERTDIISRAQAEWHFVVLSSKLYDIYKSELDDLKEKIEKLSEYDDKLWVEMRNFWAKVNDQVKSQNLFRDHATILKERTNILFEKLKAHKKDLEKLVDEKSKAVSDKFFEELKEIEEKIEKGLALKPLFEDLKGLQKKFYEADLVRKDKNKVWAKIDNAFKALKEIKSTEPRSNTGGGAQEQYARTKSRFDGLMSAIQKMESSIQRDRKDMEFEDRRILQSEGQLEMQIRKAKIIMINERMRSKQEKLDDMLKTKAQLEARMSKEEIKSKKFEAQNQVKEKIKEDIHTAESAREDIKDQLQKAASQISGETIESEGVEKTTKQKIADAIDKAEISVTETFENIVDTVKAISMVAEDKIEDLIDSIKGEEE